jgi:tetratricopeptide (TPR) repeat protein
MNTRVLFLLVFLIVLSPGQAMAEPSHRVLAQLDEEGLGLAESLLKQNRPDDAEKLGLRALETDPDSLEARLVLAKVAVFKGNFEKAQSYTTELLTADPTDSDYHALQGMVFMFQDRHDDAIECLNESLRLGMDGKASSERMAGYATTLALIQYKAGDKDEALNTALTALKNHPEDPDLHLVCSRLYRESGDFQAALEVAELGLRTNPDFPGLYASVALAQAGLGNTEASEHAFQELRRRDPELAEALRETLDGARPDDPEYQIRTD